MWRAKCEEPSGTDRALVVSLEERSGGGDKEKMWRALEWSGGGTKVCVGQREWSLVEPQMYASPVIGCLGTA